MLGQAITFAALMLLYRSVAFTGYVLVSDRVVAPVKLGVGLAVLGAVGALQLSGAPALDTLGRGLVAGLGFCCVAIFTHSLVSRARLGAAATFVSAILSFLVLPCVIAPEALRLGVAALGFEMALAAHSFFADARERRTFLPDFLVFVLVNPVLVYPERGDHVGGPALRVPGLVRVVLGMVTIIAQVVVAAWLQEAGASHPRVVALVAYDLTLYLAHSGLASLQIGLALLVGLRVSESYRFPFLATSPADFWRRWNRWLGSWARRYVYAPTRRALHGHARPGRAAAIAVLATFASIGLLHDVARLAARGRLPVSAIDALGVTAAFLLFGVEVVLWSAAARGLRAAARTSPEPNRTVRRPAARVIGASACALLHVAHGAILWHVLPW